MENDLGRPRHPLGRLEALLDRPLRDRRHRRCVTHGPTDATRMRSFSMTHVDRHPATARVGGGDQIVGRSAAVEIGAPDRLVLGPTDMGVVDRDPAAIEALVEASHRFNDELGPRAVKVGTLDPAGEGRSS